MIIPFNIKYRPQIESGEYKVRTASGKPARIVCWDMKTQWDSPIVALITDGDNLEYACTYRKDGLYVGNNENYLVIEDGQAAPGKRRIKAQIESEIEERMRNTVDELIGHEMNDEYYRLKGMHDAYVDLLTYLTYSVKEDGK